MGKSNHTPHKKFVKFLIREKIFFVALHNYSEVSNKSGGWYKHGGLRVSKK